MQNLCVQVDSNHFCNVWTWTVNRSLSSSSVTSCRSVLLSMPLTQKKLLLSMCLYIFAYNFFPIHYIENYTSKFWLKFINIHWYSILLVIDFFTRIHRLTGLVLHAPDYHGGWDSYQKPKGVGTYHSLWKFFRFFSPPPVALHGWAAEGGVVLYAAASFIVEGYWFICRFNAIQSLDAVWCG